MLIDRQTVIASNRFGFGARPGDLVRIGKHPRQWLLSQVEKTQALLPVVADLPGSKQSIRNFLEWRNDRRRQRQHADSQVKDPAAARKMGKRMRAIYLQYVRARSVQAIAGEAPFFERLVHFWSNHFAVSADKPHMFGLAGTLEFEAIRPHITGYFPDMLMAVEKHPAMLTYLDNIQSIGPHSRLARRAGKRTHRRKFDINENLAREILELHTLGVDAGYSQADVTTFAQVISGWSYGGLFPNRLDSSEPGEFAFNAFIHEPGMKTILNKQYGQSGLRQGEAVLGDLALHPATARHLASKLARHFVADEPSLEATDRLASAYLQSRGYLPAMYRVLVDLDEVWQAPFGKYKSPNDYVYSLFRTADFVPENARQLIGPLTALGQQPFRAGSPAGWPDTAEAWSGGEALYKRVELGVAVADRIGNRLDPLMLGDLVLGPTLGEHSRLAISRAGSAAQGLALLFASPEFQRR